MLTVIVVFVIIGLICTIMSTWEKPNVPLWVGVLLLYVIEMIRVLPIGK